MNSTSCSRCERLGEESGCSPKDFCQCSTPVDGLLVQAMKATYEIEAILKNYRDKHREFITYDELNDRMVTILAFIGSLEESA